MEQNQMNLEARCEKTRENRKTRCKSFPLQNFAEIVYQKRIWITQGAFTNGTLRDRMRWITSRVKRKIGRRGSLPADEFDSRIFAYQSAPPFLTPNREENIGAYLTGGRTEKNSSRKTRDTYSYLLPRNISAASVKTYTHGGFLRELRSSVALREFRRVVGETSTRFSVLLRRWWIRTPAPFEPESRERMENREIGGWRKKDIRRLPLPMESWLALPSFGKLVRLCGPLSRPHRPLFSFQETSSVTRFFM